VIAEENNAIAGEADAERRLVRPSEGRVLTGVSAGLAQYFGLHPLVYRAAFAALTLLDLAGVILYAAAWLVIPDERRGDSLVGEALRGRRQRPWLTAGVALVVLALAFGIAGSQLGWEADLVWLGALVLGISVVYAEVESTSQPGSARAGADTTATRSDRGRARGVLTILLPLLGVAIAGAGILGVLDATDVVAVDWGLALASAVVLVGLAVAAGALLAGTGALSALRTRERRRYPILLPTLGVLIAAAGVLGVLEATDVVAVDWTLALAIAVVLVGAVVAVGAFFGRTGALAVVGVLLAAVMLVAVTIEVPLRGPIGERTERPLTVASLEDEYELSIGDLTVDLRRLELPAGTTNVKAAVGIGKLVVRVPDAVRVEANADVTGGEANLFGVRKNGWQIEHDTVVDDGPAKNPTIALDVEVGFGDLEVRR
jgi:phage shock protein PspC (stress-responsive transcriptional regulator)